MKAKLRRTVCGYWSDVVTLAGLSSNSPMVCKAWGEALGFPKEGVFEVTLTDTPRPGAFKLSFEGRFSKWLQCEGYLTLEIEDPDGKPLSKCFRADDYYHHLIDALYYAFGDEDDRVLWLSWEDCYA